MFKFLFGESEADRFQNNLWISQKNEEIECLKKVIKNLRVGISEATANEPHSFDFNAVTAISISRSFDHGETPVTQIEYIFETETPTVAVMGNHTLKKLEVRKCLMRCSSEQHQKLVEEFNNQKGKKLNDI